MKYLFLVLTSLFVMNCGGGGGSDDGGSIQTKTATGKWKCVTNCNGACNYMPTVTVTATQSKLTAIANGIDDLDGTIESDGSFDISSSEQDCSGIFEGNSGTIQCDLYDGTSCQVASYKKVS